MKFYHSAFSLIFFSFISCTCFAQKRVLTLVNPSTYDRADELIILKRINLVKQFKTIRQDAYLNIANKDGRPQTVQFDDLDKDGNWDEAVFLYTFKPLERAVFSVSLINRRLNKAVVRAHVRHRPKNADNITFGASIDSDSIPAGQLNTDFSKIKLPPFLTEGPAWENDKVGFRFYFDIRNGKDIWGKTTRAMMMDTVGADPSVVYHQRASWGMDIYKVGASLSAGALAMSVKLKNGKDSLIRLGGKNMGKVIYEKIADGPLRAIFKMHYPEWNMASGFNKVSVTDEISIWGGQYFYQSTVSVKNAPEGAKLVTGFANFYQVASHELESAGNKILYSYGLQSENKDNLGLAILTPKAETAVFSQALASEKDIKESYLVTLHQPAQNAPFTFRFYAAWQPTDLRFADKDSFKKFLHVESTLYDQKIKVNWK